LFRTIRLVLCPGNYRKYLMDKLRLDDDPFLVVAGFIPASKSLRLLLLAGMNPAPTWIR